MGFQNWQYLGTLCNIINERMNGFHSRRKQLLEKSNCKRTNYFLSLTVLLKIFQNLKLFLGFIFGESLQIYFVTSMSVTRCLEHLRSLWPPSLSVVLRVASLGSSVFCSWEGHLQSGPWRARETVGWGEGRPVNQPWYVYELPSFPAPGELWPFPQRVLHHFHSKNKAFCTQGKQLSETQVWWFFCTKAKVLLLI